MNRTSLPDDIVKPTLLTSPFAYLRDWVRDSLLGYHWHQLALLVGRVLPNFLNWHARTLFRYTVRTGAWLQGPVKPRQRQAPQPVQSSGSPISGDVLVAKCTPTTWRVGESVQIFNYDCLFPQYTYEGVVPLSRAQACLKELQKWLESELEDWNGLRHHFPIEIRFSAQDDVWLSPTYETPGCYIGIVQYKYVELTTWLELVV